MSLAARRMMRANKEEEADVSGWPNASNTGYLGSMGALTSISGYTVTTAGAVVQNRLISDALNIDAANVTVRNCVINAGWYGIRVYDAGGSGLTIEDCTIIGGANCGIATTEASNVMIRRCNLYDGEDGMKIGGTNVTVRDCYIHNLYEAEGTHNDGIQCYSATGLTFYNNWIESPNNTGCISMFEGQGAWNNVLVEHNRLIGGNYPLYAGGSDATNMRVLNNTFSGWTYAPYAYWNGSGTGNVWSGNVDGGGNEIN